MRFFVFGLVALFAGSAGVARVAQAQARSAAGEPSATARVPRAEHYSLANGLRVVLAPDAAMAGLSIAVAYDVGKAHDPVSYAGLAHLAEHLTFRGSRHLTGQRMSALLDDVGASYNGFTAEEHTVYYTAAPTRALETVLYLESERMAFALDGIDEKALALEKAIVTQELSGYEKSFGRVLGDEARRAILPENHPLWPSRDQIANVQDTELAAVRWFIQRSYRPDNATLVVVGAFAREQAQALIEKYFGPIVSAPVPRRKVELTPPRVCGAHHVEIGHPFMLGKAMIFLWTLPPEHSLERRVQRKLALQVLESRLHDELVEVSFTASDVDVSLDGLSAYDEVTVWVTMQDTEAWESVEATVLREAKELARTPLSEPMLRTARARQATEAAFAREAGMHRAIELARGHWIDGTRAAIEQVDAASVQTSVAALASPQLVLRARPTRRASDHAVVLDEEGACR